MDWNEKAQDHVHCLTNNDISPSSSAPDRRKLVGESVSQLVGESVSQLVISVIQLISQPVSQ
jgi:hypothetical protein